MTSDRTTPVKAKRHLALFAAACAVAALLATNAWCEVKPAPLTDADCGKCHAEPVAQMDKDGGRHKTEMGCLGCHENHPPMGEAVIPECSDCHDGSENQHFALKDCSQCHSPHAPVIGDFDKLGEVKSACLTCHPQIGKEMAEKPSKHAEQDCSECHNQHGTAKGQFSTCLDCHEGHNDKMTYANCKQCHNPHQPTAYEWDEKTPANLCAACHEEQVAQLNKNGAAHASELHCSECHQQHPPAQQGVIPKCADCHDPDENAHFKVKNCSTCHNPHEPLEVHLDKVSPVKPVCLTCHEEPGRQMHEYPSAHAEMDCKECHEEHGEHQECLECHDGHAKDMRYDDCLACHRPHMPTHLQFGTSGIESKLCGSCHGDQYKQLSANNSKHAEVECVFCHRRTHKVVLSCDNCHGQPHDPSIHEKFEECSRCHKGPHNLRN